MKQKKQESECKLIDGISGRKIDQLVIYVYQTSIKSGYSEELKK